jgi:ABC-type dipeptide/oligopeptide/nickel transport system ATPase subunit
MVKSLKSEKLKLLLEKVVDVYSYKIVHSKDCDNLADAITAECGESISGSTMKRLFGFINSKSVPNNFNLNLLARYAGYSDFKAFEAAFFPAQTNFDNETIKSFIALNHNSKNGICDYEVGWNRMDDFLASDKQATAIIGEEGSGKSSFIASYLERNSKYNSEILFKTSIKAILENLKNYKANHQLLIIDDLEESVYNFKEIRQCIIAVNKLISLHKDLKVILSISPYSWVKIAEIISNSNQEYQWYKVNFNATNSLTSSNISSFLKLKSTIELPLSLRTPLMVEMSRSLSAKGIVNEWTIVNAFLDQKVWKTAHAFEKQQFFNVILNQTQYGKTDIRIERSQMEHLIVKYKKAHLDLVTVNILSEHKELNKYGVFKSYYQFGKSIFLTYFLLSFLLEKHKGFNEQLLQEIVDTYEGEMKLDLLKLASSFALTTFDSNVSKIFDFNFIEYERQSLMIHLAYQIRGNKELQEKVLPSFIDSNNGRKYFIERWIDEENLNGFYGEVIKKYLTKVDSHQDLIFGNALLYYNAFLNKNESDCKRYSQAIYSLKNKGQKIHPYVLGRKYMTLLLEENRINGNYSENTRAEVNDYLLSNLKEGDDDLPVHFSGFEFNILHAEFLTGNYLFTENILKNFKSIEPFQLHEKDCDLLLIEIFEEAFKRSQGEIHKELNYNIEDIHSWHKTTVKNYIDKLNQKK